MSGIVHFILRRKALLATLSLATLVIPVWLLPQTRIDNSLEVWMSRQSEEFEHYEQFRNRYGSDEMIIIAAAISDPLSPRALAVQRETASALRLIEGVRDVTSLPDVDAAILARSPDDTAEPSKHPLIRNLLLSEDGKTIGMVAWLRSLAGSESRRDVVDAVRRASGIMARHGYEPHIVGAPVLNVQLDRVSSQEAARLLPVAAVLSLGMLLVLFRSVTVPAVCLLATAATLLWTIAAMVLSGATFNLMSVPLPALLLVLAMAPGTHIAARYLSHLKIGAIPNAAMQKTVEELFIPILLTTLTTALGFASLLITDMQPVFEVGLFAMLGIVLSFVFSLAVVPGPLLWLPTPRNHGSTFSPKKRHWTAAAGAAMAARPKLVVMGSSILLIAFGLLAAKVRTETNVLSFLPADSEIAADYRFVSDRLTGLYTLEMDVAVPAGEEHSAQAALCGFGEVLAANPHVARVDHHGQFQPLLATKGVMARLPAALDPVRRAAGHFRVVDDQSVHLRASILVRSMASTDFDSVIDAARREATTRLPATAQWDFTGAVLLMSNAQTALIRTQVRSFAIALGLVLLVMGVLMRSWRAMVASIVPNLLPVMAMFALMAMLKISLNAATVMIASVAIGLAVDGTIHFLSCYRKAVARDRVLAAGEALEMSGRPIVYTALVAAAGFALLTMSGFTPLREFGLLTGVTLIVAMLCDVLITPAWAAFLRPWESSNAVAGS